MEEIKLIISNDASLYLDELIEILYKNNYFGFLESSVIYVTRIYEFIDENIVNFPSKKTPSKLSKLGSNYIFYKINQRTTWYIFFEQQEKNYIITNIINNYCQEANWL